MSFAGGLAVTRVLLDNSNPGTAVPRSHTRAQELVVERRLREGGVAGPRGGSQHSSETQETPYSLSLKGGDLTTSPQVQIIWALVLTQLICASFRER